MAYEYVKAMYGVDPVPGNRTSHQITGREGVIARRRSYDHYVYVRFDGKKHATPCHPTELTYPDAEMDDPINLQGSGPAAIELREG